MAVSTTVRAIALLALALGGAGSAWAGRSTQIDAPITAPPCTLGATSCGFVNVSESGVFSRAYVYREGIVSFDALLPATANASDPASLGTGWWFAPGLTAGAAYRVGAYYSPGFVDADNAIPGFFAFNWWRSDTPDDVLYPEMQVVISAGTGRYVGDVATGGWDGLSIAFGYDVGVPLPEPNALIGLSWNTGETQVVRNADGLLVGPLARDTDFVSTVGIRQADGTLSAPTRFVPLFAATGVPEPATWAMLVAGFGLAGAALRRRPRAGAAFA